MIPTPYDAIVKRLSDRRVEAMHGGLPMSWQESETENEYRSRAEGYAAALASLEVRALVELCKENLSVYRSLSSVTKEEYPIVKRLEEALAPFEREGEAHGD